jgi:ribosomal protein S18 acetylase RimI-like enzyme
MHETEPELQHVDIDEVEVALAVEADYADIRELFLDGLIEGHVRMNDTGADIENLREAYFSDDGASGLWVARYQGRIIGMIGVQRTAENAAEIRRLRVREAYRRRGVGTLLMKTALAFCSRHGYLKVVLDVRIERGPAIALFEKFGFVLARSREIGGRKLLDFYVDLYTEPDQKGG